MLVLAAFLAVVTDVDNVGVDGADDFVAATAGLRSLQQICDAGPGTRA